MNPAPRKFIAIGGSLHGRAIDYSDLAFITYPTQEEYRFLHFEKDGFKLYFWVSGSLVKFRRYETLINDLWLQAAMLYDMQEGT